MMGRAEAWAAGALLAVLTIGVVLLPLQLPWFTETLSARYSEMPEAVGIPLAEASRSFVVAGDARARRALERVMTPEAISHLEDVHAVLRAANAAVFALGLALAAWAWWRGRRRPELVAGALGAAAVLLGAGVLLAAGTALFDFDAFFSAFHGLFFEPGTWTFPSDSVLIRLFPEPFWTAAGAAWAALILLVAAGYGVGWAVLSRRLRGVDGG